MKRVTYYQGSDGLVYAVRHTQPIDVYKRQELDTTSTELKDLLRQLWIDYFRELDTTFSRQGVKVSTLWIDYFRERDTTEDR